MRSNKLLFLLCLMLALAPAAALGADATLAADATPQDEALSALAKILPEGPALATEPIVQTLEAAAKTRRLDAAVLLIQALAFNYDPGISNESRSRFEMMPAAVLLRTYYGPRSLPLLLVEGVRTDKDWLRTRIALAAREIGKGGELDRLARELALETSASPHAKELARLLKTPEKDLDLKLFSPGMDAAERALRGLKKGKPSGA